VLLVPEVRTDTACTYWYCRYVLYLPLVLNLLAGSEHGLLNLNNGVP
jgi:hypothetical protein